MTDPAQGSRSRFGFWHKWMVIYSILGIVFGLVMAFGSTSALFQSYNRSVSQAFWGQSGLHEAVINYHPWVFAVLGSTLTGWFVCLLFLALSPFGRRERWAYVCFIVSLLIWAPLDSAFSIHFGIYKEAVFNLGAVLGYAIPLSRPTAISLVNHPDPSLYDPGTDP